MENSLAIIDWQQLFYDYISDEKMSYKKLAERYNIPLKIIEYRGLRDNWPHRRSEAMELVYQKIQKQAVNDVLVFRKKQIELGKYLTGKALKLLTKDNFELKNTRDILAFLIEGLRIEGIGLGFENAKAL